MGTYRPTGQYQLGPDGGTHGAHNCTPVSFAVGVDYATLGGSRVTGSQIRAWSDEPSPDTSSPGMNLPQCISVCKSRLGVSWANRTGDQWADLVTNIKSGRGVVLQYMYGVLPAEFRYSTTFVGPHASFISDVDSTGRLLFYDPLRKDGAPRWVPASHVQKAALALSKKWGIAGIAYATTRVVQKIVT